MENLRESVGRKLFCDTLCCSTTETAWSTWTRNLASRYSGAAFLRFQKTRKQRAMKRTPPIQLSTAIKSCVFGSKSVTDGVEFACSAAIVLEVSLADRDAYIKSLNGYSCDLTTRWGTTHLSPRSTRRFALPQHYPHRINNPESRKSVVRKLASTTQITRDLPCPA